MKKNKIIFSIVLFSISLQQCGNPFGPTDIVVKNPREYTWTIDTVFFMTGVTTTMESISASSPNDVYIAGYCDDWRGRIWHYNGEDWQMLDTPIGDARYRPKNVYVFSSKNVWIAGYNYPEFQSSDLDSNMIVHFDGAIWNNFKTAGDKELFSVWGNSPNDVWFGGLNSTLFHWDGNEVKPDSIPFVSPQNNITKSISGKLTGETYFLVSTLSTDMDYLLLNKQNKWSVIDSSTRHSNNYWNHIWVSEIGNIYETGLNAFYKLTGSNWTNLFAGFVGETIGINGTSDNNIFVVGLGASPGSGGEYTSLVYHYNGKDLYLYENLRLKDVVFYDVWTDGTEVFIVGITNWFPRKTVILHGK